MAETHIQAIGTAVPEHRLVQERMIGFMRAYAASAAEGSPRDRRRLGARIAQIFRRSAIDTRHSVVGDYVAETPEHFTLYPPNERFEPFPTTAARMELYRAEAPALALRAARACLSRAHAIPRSAISHVIVVSCTGFFAPGIDILLTRALGLRADVQRQVIGFMGCYASFNALRAAHAICRAEPSAAVLIVSVELCSLHFQRELDLSTIVTNSLFGDGAAAVLVTGRARPPGVLAIVDSHCALEEDDAGLERMTWTVTDTGFRMTLSADVPDALERGIEAFVGVLLRRHQLSRAQLGFWAVHPGGRRILDVIKHQLDVPEALMAPSYGVLAEFGNMSSATVLFVLERCLSRAEGHGLALAFGPGLTFESMLFRAIPRPAALEAGACAMPS